MRALQVDKAPEEEGPNYDMTDLADGCKGLSSGSPLPMEFHSSGTSIVHIYSRLTFPLSTTKQEYFCELCK